MSETGIDIHILLVSWGIKQLLLLPKPVVAAPLVPPLHPHYLALGRESASQSETGIIGALQSRKVQTVLQLL